MYISTERIQPRVHTQKLMSPHTCWWAIKGKPYEDDYWQTSCYQSKSRLILQVDSLFKHRWTKHDISNTSEGHLPILWQVKQGFKLSPRSSQAWLPNITQASSATRTRLHTINLEKILEQDASSLGYNLDAASSLTWHTPSTRCCFVSSARGSILKDIPPDVVLILSMHLKT